MRSITSVASVLWPEELDASLRGKAGLSPVVSDDKNWQKLGE
jgi:hypothetical protein